MLNIYSQFRNFHVFKRFKHLLGDWWNMDILIVVKNKDKFFYDNIGQLNNTIVRSFLESPLFKNYFLSSVNMIMNKKTDPQTLSKMIPWKQTGLNLFIVPLALKDNSAEACLVATGFAPSKKEKLNQSLSYLNLSKKAIEQQLQNLKNLSQTDEIYIQKMLKILAEEFFLLFQEKQKQARLIEKLNQEKTIQKYSALVGKSPAMHYIFTILEKIKNHDANILIEGENGTGKKLLAKTIHDQSLRAKKAFHSQNFSAFKGKLLELELFGYSRQAFPSACREKKALLEKINGGTLLLNEIGNTSLAFQSKLLKFLKEGVFFSEGDSKQKKANVRVISSTSKDLKLLVEQGQFNEELYLAISTITIKTPVLNQRKEDIPLLVEHFLKKKSPVQQKKCSAKALSALYNYSWPGNIQELESEIEKVISLTPNTQNIFTEQNLSVHIRDSSSVLNSMFEPGKQDLKSALRSFEKKILLDCLRKYNWNKTRVAKLLGTSRTSIVLKSKEYGLIKKEGA